MDKYVTIKYTEAYGDRYLQYSIGDKIPTISEKKKDDILYVFEIVSKKSANNFNSRKWVFEKKAFKDLRVLVGANPGVDSQQDFSLCVNEITGKHILISEYYTYQLGNKVQPIIRKSSKSEEKRDQARNAKQLFNSTIKNSFEEILRKYGAEIDKNPYRFSETGSKRNYVALDVNFNKLKQILTDELTKQFGVKIKLESGSSTFRDNEFAQLDVTQLLQKQ